MPWYSHGKNASHFAFLVLHNDGFQATAGAISRQWDWWPPSRQFGGVLELGPRQVDAPCLLSGSWGLQGGNCLKSHNKVP